jgi:hypothetical protein
MISSQLSGCSEHNNHDLYDKVLLQYGLYSTGTHQKGTISVSELSKKWFIGIETARRTLDRTTHMGVCDFSNVKGTSRLKHTAHQLMFCHIRTDFYTNTMFSKVKSLRQNICAQVYVTQFRWMKVYPLKKKLEAYLSLDQLQREIGVFRTITPAYAMELTDGQFRTKAILAGSDIRPVEACSHNQNLAESGIFESRRMYRKSMLATNAPCILRDYQYCLQLMVEIRSNSVFDIFELERDTPTTLVTRDTADISYLCEFSWYENV